MLGRHARKRVARTTAVWPTVPWPTVPWPTVPRPTVPWPTVVCTRQEGTHGTRICEFVSSTPTCTKNMALFRCWSSEVRWFASQICMSKLLVALYGRPIGVWNVLTHAPWKSDLVLTGRGCCQTAEVSNAISCLTIDTESLNVSFVSHKGMKFLHPWPWSCQILGGSMGRTNHLCTKKERSQRCLGGSIARKNKFLTESIDIH